MSALIQVARSLRSLPGCTKLLLDINSDVGVGMANSLTRAGTSPPNVAVSGSGPAFQLDVKIASVAAGTALGQATYQLSINGGAFTAAAATTGTPIALGNGWFIAFGTGTFNTNQTWKGAIVTVTNDAASNFTEPVCQCFGPIYTANARGGLPGFHFDTGYVYPGAGSGGQIQSFSCTATTATVDAPYTAIWTALYTATAGATWSMGSNGVTDGSTFAFGAGGTTLNHVRRAGTTSLQTVHLWTFDSAWHVFAARYNGTQIEFWVDAAKVLSYTTIQSTGSGDMSNANMLRIGASYDDTTAPGDYQQFAMYQGLLTDYELAVATRAVQERYRFV